MSDTPLTDAQRIEQYINAFRSQSIVHSNKIIVKVRTDVYPNNSLLPVHQPDTVCIRDSGLLWTFLLARVSDIIHKWRVE